MKRLLFISALGVGLLVAACVPPPPPPPVPHQDWYLTEVQVQPASPTGTYQFKTTCTLDGGGTAPDHLDTIAHTAGTLTVQNFNWAPTDVSSCSVTETAGPAGAPSYWLNATNPAPFGTPPTYHPITAPTTTPQSCTLTLEGTYENYPGGPLDVWGNCFYAVSNA